MTDSGLSEEAMKWYQKRVDMGGFKEEVFISLLRLGQLASGLQVHEYLIKSLCG